MIRVPTCPAAAYAWHERALAQVAADVQIEIPNDPQPGYFKRRLVKGGVFVPAKIWIDQEVDAQGELVADEVLLCEVAFRRRDPFEEWFWIAPNPISLEEFRRMIATIDHADRHLPNAPELDPRRKIDWLRKPVTRVPKA